MQITSLKIGQAPDYVMTLNRMTVFHRIRVHITSTKLNQSESMPISHRSLWIAAKQAQDFMRSRLSINESVEFTNDDKLGFIEIIVTDFLIKVENHLPPDLNPIQERLLRRKFTDYFRYFLESLNK